jgi:hypothetical protein
MAVDLFELASGYLNSSAVSKIAGILGESPSEPEAGNTDTQVVEKIGGRDRGRTGDLIVANDALSQLSYSPTSSMASLAKDMSDSNTRKALRFQNDAAQRLPN